MNKKVGMWRSFLVLMAMLLIVSCGKPAADSGPAREEEAPTETVDGSGNMPFELVSIERVDSQRSNSAAGNTIYWEKNGEDSGLLIVLKLKTPELLEFYSSDFSLGYKDEAGIPRSACVGISSGQATTDYIKVCTWMLGGAMSRSWALPEKPYFGILFPLPRKVSRVTLYYAAPLMRDLQLPTS